MNNKQSSHSKLNASQTSLRLHESNPKAFASVTSTFKNARLLVDVLAGQGSQPSFRTHL